MPISNLIYDQMQRAGQPREITQTTTMDPGGSSLPDLSSIGMLIMTLLDMQKQNKRMDEWMRMMFGGSGAQPMAFGSFDANKMSPMDLFSTLKV